MPKKTLEIVIESENNYLVKVKANQPKLLASLLEVVHTKEVLDHFQEHERSRGRLENRETRVYARPESLDPQWRGVKHVVYSRRWGQPQGAAYHTQSYYISSLSVTAKEFAKGIRGHWLIENRLHWVKDVTFNEDDSQIRDTNAAANLSLMKTLAINLYRLEGYQSMKTANTYFANKVKELLKFMRT